MYSLNIIIRSQAHIHRVESVEQPFECKFFGHDKQLWNASFPANESRISASQTTPPPAPKKKPKKNKKVLIKEIIVNKNKPFKNKEAK